MTIATSAIVSDARIDGCEPRYESRGWMHWPQHEDHSLQFQRLLGSAQDGAAYISECFLTARRIKPGCDDSWCAEWIALAERTRDHAEASAGRGHGESAGAAWLRATSYFLAARCFLPPSDRRWSQLYLSIEACSVAYLRTLRPRGRLVQIPYEGNSLCGYFLRARAASERTPVVLCCGGPYESKENQLLKFTARAIDRGLSLLLVDLPGQGATRLRNNVAGRHDVESAISACVDYLIAHPEADGERIAIYGDGLGAAYASRAASLDGRFAAAVCDGGAWDLRERLILRSWFFGESDRREAPLDYQYVGRILCPFLMMAGDQDHLESSDMRELHRRHRRMGTDASLKIFSVEETGASHAQNDNPCIGAEFAFDWLTDRLGAASRQPVLETTTEE
jgi:dienelactone hydrolase